MFTCLCCDELSTMRSRVSVGDGGWSERRKVEEEKKVCMEGISCTKIFQKEMKSFTHIAATMEICLSIYIFSICTCSYCNKSVIMFLIDTFERASRAESECSLYFRIPALEVYKVFLIQISVWLLMGSFIIHRFSITEGILLLWRNVFIRFKVHSRLAFVEKSINKPTCFFVTEFWLFSSSFLLFSASIVKFNWHCGLELPPGDL